MRLQLANVFTRAVIEFRKRSKKRAGFGLSWCNCIPAETEIAPFFRPAVTQIIYKLQQVEFVPVLFSDAVVRGTVSFRSGYNLVRPCYAVHVSAEVLDVLSPAIISRFTGKRVLAPVSSSYLPILARFGVQELDLDDLLLIWKGCREERVMVSEPLSGSSGDRKRRCRAASSAS